MKITFTLNRQPVTINTEPMRRLLDVLREDFELLGTKESCGEGECGACTVLLAGKPVTSCLVNCVHVEGKEVFTSEGLAMEPLGKLLIDCFDELHALIQQLSVIYTLFTLTTYQQRYEDF